MRYHRQGYEIPVALEPDEIRTGGLADLEERFNGLHEQLYGFRMPGTASEIVNLRAVGFGAVPKPELPVGELGGADASGAVVDEHEVVFDGERVRDEDLRPREAAAGGGVRRAGDRDRVRLDDGRPPRLRAPSVDSNFNILITPNDVSEGEMATTEELRIAEIPDVEVDPVTLDIIEGRAEERALRDGRRALPVGDEPRHPRAARRVPDDHRPARPHGRRPVRRLHQRDDGGVGPAASTRAT